jgi:hypothetical protein
MKRYYRARREPIVEAMRSLGLTVRALSARWGTSAQYVYYIIAGIKPAGPNLRRRFSGALGRPEDALFEPCEGFEPTEQSAQTYELQLGL